MIGPLLWPLTAVGPAASAQESPCIKAVLHGNDAKTAQSAGQLLNYLISELVQTTSSWLNMRPPI